MKRFVNIFKKECSLIAMVHLNALPGTPNFAGSIDKIVSKACKETEIYLKNQVDGILVENMHDVPYIQAKNFGPEVAVTMTRVCTEIRKIVPKNVPCGVQILSCGNQEALAVAKACSLNFIRAEGYVFAHVGDEGFTNANAGKLLRYRKSIDAQDVLVFADIKKKHSSHAITNDISLEETAKAAEYFLADGLVLTGISTGHPANPQELTSVKKCTDLPILIGSGVTEGNLENYSDATALIVGSHFKVGGKWFNNVDEDRVRKFCEKFQSLYSR